MLNLFKNFGKGILYVLVLPFLLVGLALYAVVAIFVFLFLAIKGLILFFTGRSLYEDLPEDKEAKKRIAQANGATLEEPQETFQEEQQENILEDPQESQNEKEDIDNDPFYIPQYMKEEVQVEEQEPAQEEPVLNEETPVEESNIQEEPVIEKVPKNEKILSKNAQNDAFLEIDEENDDDQDDSGITIDFE